MNKTHAPSSISHVARCGLVLVPISSNQSQVTCGRCQRYFDSDKKVQKNEKQITDSLIAFVLVIGASYAAITIDRMARNQGCQPAQLAIEHGKHVLLSVCKTPL